MQLRASILALGLLAAACDRGEQPAPAPVSQTATPTSSAEPSASAAPSAAPSLAVPPPDPSCPSDMVLAAGSYCPQVEHKCLQHTTEWKTDQERREELKKRGIHPPPSRIAERCLRFAEPGKCLSKERRPLRFCIDRHEWPNRPGEKPAFLVTWVEAREACTQAGKRLCTADEFNFACEGEYLLPYSYGYERDERRCNIDKPYVTPRRTLMPYDECQKRPACKEHLAELDQREPIGASQCTSPFGALDLNGNVNEWVERPGQEAPWRSGLKGGWWGPARSRCRPMVIAHNENYTGYEVGFRCCKDAK